MAMIVQHNLTAMNSNRMLGITSGQQAKSSEKLSSGYRINRAADDAAGLSISEKMRKQIRGLDRASTNAQDGVSAVQTAEGALTEVHSMLQRMNELANQAANGTNSESDRDAIQAEIDQLVEEIDRVAETTKFNESYLLKGDSATSKKYLAAHDAGIDGTLTDNEDGTAKFEIDLAVGNKVSIAGKDYTIVEDDKADKDDDDLTIKASDAAEKIAAELKTANQIGVTVNKEAVTVTPSNDAKAEKVKEVSDLETITAKKDFIIFDGANYQHVKAGDNITELAKNENAKFYDEKVAQGDSLALGAGGVTTELLLQVHTADDKIYGVKEIASNTTVTAGEAFGTPSNNATTIANDYAIYAAADVADLINEEVAHKASAKLDTANGVDFTITFEELGTDVDTAEKIAEGQNALLAEMGGINFIATDAVGNGEFSHNFGANSKLDIDKAGVVKYDGVKIAEIGADKSTAGTPTVGTSSPMAVTLGSSVEAKAVTLESKPSTMYTFDIQKGQTEGAKALNFNLHVGADADMSNKINVNIDAMSAENLGIKGIEVAGDTGMPATYAIDAIADAISKVSAQRSALGAVQNRLEHTIANLDNVVENTTAAESRIRDTDMAAEMVEYSKNNILAQAGQSMLAQANQATQGVLSLLG